MRGAGDDRRRVWRTFASATSNVFFAAILAGPRRLAIGEIGWWAWRRPRSSSPPQCSATDGLPGSRPSH
jgi:hypothetical protein